MLPAGFKIISGGQTGADRAALDWAIRSGIPHGGWCPKGRKAEDGRIAARYALAETPSRRYAQRTDWNVRDSDATVIFTGKPCLHGGNKKTLEFARRYRKPCLVLSRSDSSSDLGLLLSRFISLHRVRVLNVAGSRSSQEPHIARFVRTVLDAWKARNLKRKKTCGSNTTLSQVAAVKLPTNPRRSAQVSCQPCRLVAIVGGSGSGKTWLADKLHRAFAPHAITLSLDDFYRDRSQLSAVRRANINFDHPRAIDWRRFETVLCGLLAGRPVSIPDYDFGTHSRRRRAKTLRPKPLVLVDGLWLLRRPSLRRLFSLTIFLDCSTRTRLLRRLRRDHRSRARTDESIRRQFWRTVQPMHARYVIPQSLRADIVLKTCRQADLESIIKRIHSQVLAMNSAPTHLSVSK